MKSTKHISKKEKIGIDPMVEARKNKGFKNHYDAAVVRIKLGVEIFNARKAKKISQQELAKKIGTTQKIISNIENGDINIGIDLLNRLAKNLGFTSETLGKIFDTPVLYWYPLRESGVFRIEVGSQVKSNFSVKI
jgi:ribosome-binding protein aMBF1 (putative translation factor)